MVHGYAVDVCCDECGMVLRQWLGRLPVGDTMHSHISSCPNHPEGKAVVKIVSVTGRIVLDTGMGVRLLLSE